MLKQFYKFLKGDSEEFSLVVKWIKTAIKNIKADVNHSPYIGTKELIQKIIEYMKKLMGLENYKAKLSFFIH